MENLPLFESSDPDIENAYYFRSKSYHSHMMPTGYVNMPYVVSEFGRAVHWGGPFGSINAAVGHHISEGRWIRDRHVMDSLIKFWVASMSGGDSQLHPHFKNGTSGKIGSTPYSMWLVTAAEKRARVVGDVELGLDWKGNKVDPAGVLDQMVNWWEARTMQTRLDCAMARQNKDKDWESCPGSSPGTYDYPFCYIIVDGWDAMEKSISGAGCRPTVGAMKFGDALAIASIARQLGNQSLADSFTERAKWIQEEYLKLLWNEEIEFFSVYKENLQGNTNYGCQEPHESQKKQPGAEANLTNLPGCPPNWPCNKTVTVRELLGLGPAYYFSIVPKEANGSKYEAMWPQLFDDQGFWAKYGPTTAERRHKCFNFTQGTAECSWNGMSWPYETSRVLTGLSNLLVEYPKAAADKAGMSNAHFTKLLATYARSQTQGKAANGSTPWVGEDIEPDKGYWVAREIMYNGGERPTPVNCTACAADPRPRNCGSWTVIPTCCGEKGEANCDGKVIPTPDKDRGKDYNHSTFLDIVISGLVGIRAAFGKILAIHPLADETITYFALDNLAYHGHNLTVAWDLKGGRYCGNGCCKGLCVWVDGNKVVSGAKLAPINITLP